MSLETNIPKEIEDYKEKIVLGLSVRQLVTVGCAIAVLGVTALILTGLLHIPVDAYQVFLVIEAVPFACYGFVRPDNMDFDKWAMIVFQHKFGTNKLPYQTSSHYMGELYALGQAATEKMEIEKLEEAEHVETKQEQKAKQKRIKELKKQGELVPGYDKRR